jgi:gliding motility-associated-like protein
MKNKLTIVLFFILCHSGTLFAVNRFIKTASSVDYGNQIRIVATSNDGWATFSLDSLKLTQFTKCGDVLWSKQVIVPNTNIGLGDFISTSNGNFLLLTRYNNGNEYCSLVTKIDASGNIIWSRSYEQPQFNQFPYTLSENNQGNFLVFANIQHNTTNQVFNMLIKFDSNGNQIATNFYDHGGIWGSTIATSDGGALLRTGSLFVKVNTTGAVQWTSIVSSSTYNYFSPVEVNDGYIFTGYNTGGNKICFMKIDKLGNEVWGGKIETDFSGSPPFLKPLPNGNFACVMRKNNYVSVFEFDKNLDVIRTGSVSLATSGMSIFNTDICFTSSGVPVLGGIATGGNLCIAKFDLNFGTDCSITAPSIQKNVVPIIQTFSSTTTSSNPVNVIAKNYATAPFSITFNTICATAKLLDLGNDTVLCKNTFITLQNLTSDVFDFYQWSTGETTPSITVSQPGVYWLLVSDECNLNSKNDTVWITVLPSIAPNLGPDKYICPEESILLSAPQCTNCVYTWSNGSETENIEIDSAGVYWLAVDNGNGCINTDSILISHSKCDCSFYIPNAFTPNGDGINEIFKPVYDCEILNYSMQLYNRWGQLIFESENPNSGWNGTYQNQKTPEGVYVYRIKYSPVIRGIKTGIEIKTGRVVLLK